MVKIVTFRWEEPEAGLNAEIWEAEPAAWQQIESAVAWVREHWEDEDEDEGQLGSTVVETTIHGTAVSCCSPSGDAVGLQDCLQRLADNVRYSTGEGLYESDCPVFAAVGIVRS